MLIFVISLLAINNKWSKSEMSIGVLKRKFNFRLKCKNTRIFHYNLLWSNKRSRKKKLLFCYIWPSFHHSIFCWHSVTRKEVAPLIFQSIFTMQKGREKMALLYFCLFFSDLLLSTCDRLNPQRRAEGTEPIDFTSLNGVAVTAQCKPKWMMTAKININK